MEIDYKARVLKGAALLDKKKPGWEREIDLGVLDIQSGYYCVTAQLGGKNDWRVDLEQLELTTGDSGTYIAHGFDMESTGAPEAYGLDDAEPYDEIVSDAQSAAYDTLNRLWRDLITDRLAREGGS